MNAGGMGYAFRFPYLSRAGEKEMILVSLEFFLETTNKITTQLKGNIRIIFTPGPGFCTTTLSKGDKKRKPKKYRQSVSGEGDG